MALTYRKVKGSALTIDELDANFAHFTGSHSITGSLTVSGSIIPSEVNGTLGTATAPWKELYVDGGTIYFISGSSSGSLSWNSGSGFNFGTGSVTFDGGLTVTGSVTISGSSTLTNIGPFVNEGDITVTEEGKITVENTSGPQLILKDISGSINIGDGAGGPQVSLIGGGSSTQAGNAVAIGSGAMSKQNSGTTGIAIGYQALSSSLSVRGDVAIGYHALVNAGSTGATGGHVAIGLNAMSSSLGQYSGVVAVGTAAGAWNSGSQNIYVGNAAGGTTAQFAEVKTNNSIFIGYNSRPSGSGDNQIVIDGKGTALGKGENTVVLGNTDIDNTYLFGTLNLESVPTSDPGVAGAVWRDGTDLKISI